MSLIGYHEYSLPSMGYPILDRRKLVFSSPHLRLKRKKNYDNLMSFLKNALNSLNIKNIKIIPRFNIYIKSRKNNSGTLFIPYSKGIEFNFKDLNLSIIYTSKYYEDKDFNVLKENMLVAFLLHRSSYNLKSFFNLNDQHENFHFLDYFSLVDACNIYLRHKEMLKKNI